MERFGLIGERVTYFTRDVNGTLQAQRVRTDRYGLRRAGVRAAGSSTSATTVVDAWVYSDDQSYSTKFQEYGTDEEQRITFAYATGPLVTTTQDTWKWHRPKARIDGGSGYQLYDGTGQSEAFPVFELVERKVLSDVVGQGQKKGSGTVTYAWSAPRRVGGDHDWGEFESDAEVELFQFVSSETAQFNKISEEQLEEVSYPPGGGRVARLILGRQPITLYTASVWTRLATEPFEVVVDDATVESWFGFSREVITSEYIQDPAEAHRVIDMRRRRKLAPKLEIVRPDSPAKKGDTVHYSAPEDGVNDRFLIAAKSQELDMSSPQPMATYRLEAW
jgi:hypothetical protein